MKVKIGIFLALSLGGVFGVVPSSAETVELASGRVEVVVAGGAPEVVKFAATELSTFLTQVFASKVPVVTKASGMRTPIRLGSYNDDELMAELGKLPRDSFRIEIGHDGVRISGLDDRGRSTERFLKGKASFFGQQRATLHGVYAFLEKHFGVRFYFPGELGTIVPKSKKVTIETGVETVIPAFQIREWYNPTSNWFGREDGDPENLRNLDWLRLRMGTQRIPCCHGLIKFCYVERFGETHPEYFALMKNGRRSIDPKIRFPGQLCYTSGIKEEIYQDVKAYLTGQDASSRGLKEWGRNCNERFVDIMSQDGLKECNCDNCRRATAAAKAVNPKLWGRDVIWQMTADVANRLQREGINGSVVQMSYGAYNCVPPIDLPTNVQVQVAKMGPWVMDYPEIAARDDAVIEEWVKKLGHKVWLWNYLQSQIAKHPHLAGIPHVTPHHWGEYYKRQHKNIIGAFAESESLRFSYNYLNYYVYSRVLWDEKTDVDAVLDEHYRLMFGAAAPEMKQLFEELERKWCGEVIGEPYETPVGPICRSPTPRETWEGIYGKDTRQRWLELLKAASDKVPDGSLEARRIELIRNEYLVPLELAALREEETFRAIDTYRAKGDGVTPIELRPYKKGGRVKASKGFPPAHATAAVKDGRLEVVFSLSEPQMRKVVAAAPVRDNAASWEENSVELFVNASGDRKTVYHFIVTSAGSFADMKGSDLSWNSGAEVKVDKQERTWTASLSIPLSSMPGFGKVVPMSFCRDRVVEDLDNQLYLWGPASIHGFPDVQNFGSVEFGDPEPPYEFKWANRTADEFEPIARLESVEGWRIEAVDAEAKLESATDRVLFGKGVMRLKFRANGKNPHVRIMSQRLIPCPDGFDTVSVWLYGNTKNGSDTLSAVFADAGNREESLSLGKVRHLEWHDQIAVVTKRSPLYGRKGLSFVGFELSMATNTEFRTMDLTSLSVFVDPKRPIPFNPRPKRGVRLFERQDQGHNVGPGTLPFPNTRDTVLPPRREVKGLEFRLPKDDSIDWSDLAFRVDGGGWVSLARGGGLFPAAVAKGAKVRFVREANSVVAFVEAPKGVEEVRFGAMAKPEHCVSVNWPYMTLVWCDENDIPGYQKRGVCNPQTAFVEAGGRKVVVGAMFDWTQSSAFAPTCRDDAQDGEVQLCPAVKYVPKTNGEMNPVCERFVWTVAETAGDVFTTIPNPPSPYMKEMSVGVWRSNPAVGDRTANREYWKKINALGIDHLIVTDHETGWRDGEESFTFRTCTAPGRGGDRSQYEYARFMIDEMGFRYGLYTGLDDLATVNGNYSIDRVARRWDGTLVPAWRRCYIPKSTWSVQYAGEQAKEIQRKFGINTSYCDVHTCKTPWQCGDCDARAPGAATFAQTFYDFGEIFLTQKAAWNGPVYSEGAFHWWYSGLIDGNYAQDYTYNMDDRPWLVDFDLRRLHEKSVNFGVGSPKMLYRSAKNKPDPVKERESYLMRFIAVTLAFGHGGYLACVVDPVNVGFVSNDLECEEVSYFLVQGIAAKYTLAAAKEVFYADDDGRFHRTEEAAFNGALFSSRVKIVYSDGTVVVVNGSKTKTLQAALGCKTYQLPPNGWVALAGDNTAGSMNVMEGSRRIQRAWSNEYRYERIDGKSSTRKINSK